MRKTAAGATVFRVGKIEQKVGGRLSESGFAVGLLLLLVEVVASELLLEALDAAKGVDESLLTREEWVRARPNFNIHLWNRCADGHHDLATEDDLALGVVLWMNVVLHGVASFGLLRCVGWLRGMGDARNIEA